jgi:hypothetical protein
MSETEVNVSKSDVQTEVKTYSEDQFKGLLADKQAEVKKRQDAEKHTRAGNKKKKSKVSGSDLSTTSSGALFEITR